MDSKRTKAFKKLYITLPDHVKESARKQYKYFLENQYHPSLRTKLIGSTRRLSENGYFPQSLRQAQIIILEILKCIPVVIIFAFPRSKSGIFDLILEKISHSQTAS